MAAFRTLDDIQLAGRTALVRVDFNVPMDGGKVTDATRITRALPTIRRLLDGGAKVVLLSHFGRPKGERKPEMSLSPLVPELQAALGEGVPVTFAEDCIGEEAEAAVRALPAGGVLLLENLRFHAGEEKNDPGFADQLAALGDLFVSDAFSAAHRAHASVEGIAHRLPAVAGLLMQVELEALEKVLENPERPLAAVVGGAKVSTKLELLGNLVAKVQLLVIGGVGRSLCERDMASTVEDIVRKARESDCDIVLPTDAAVARELKPNVSYDIVPIKQVPEDSMILDVGPRTAEHIAQRLASCRTLVWNGPLGAFEVQPFDAGTNHVAQAAAELTRRGEILSVAGGGDTVSALNHAGVLQDFSYVSAAGGAFLEWLEGKTLPGVQVLRNT